MNKKILFLSVMSVFLVLALTAMTSAQYYYGGYGGGYDHYPDSYYKSRTCDFGRCTTQVSKSNIHYSSYYTKTYNYPSYPYATNRLGYYFAEGPYYRYPSHNYYYPSYQNYPKYNSPYYHPYY